MNPRHWHLFTLADLERARLRAARMKGSNSDHVTAADKDQEAARDEVNRIEDYLRRKGVIR